MTTSGRRHKWVQLAFVSGVFALLMLTDHNGNPLARAVIGTAALAAFVYAVIRMSRGDHPAT
jgi:hypothetical protein